MLWQRKLFIKFHAAQVLAIIQVSATYKLQKIMKLVIYRIKKLFYAQ
jgi:hypothetical protein